MKRIVLYVCFLVLVFPYHGLAENVFTAGGDGVIVFLDFETDLTDSVGSYDLSELGVVGYTTDNASTGTYAGDFVASENDGARILDADLDEYFPGDSSWSAGDFAFAVTYTPTDATPSSLGGIFSKWLSGTDYAYSLLHRNTTGEIEWWTGSDGSDGAECAATAQYAMTDGHELSIVISCDQSDGQCDFSVYDRTASDSIVNLTNQTASPYPAPTSRAFYVNKHNESNSYDCTGQIDSLVVWNRELTSDEISQIHAETYGAGAWTGHSRGNYSSIPTDADPLETQFSGTDDTNVATDNDTYVVQDAETTDVYAVFQFKDEQSDSSLYIYPTIQLKSQEAPSSHTVTLSIWDAQTDTAWDSKATDSATAADTEFYLTPQITTGMSDYVDNDNYINFMVYQQGDNEDTVSVDWWKTDYGIAGVDDVTWVEAQATGSSIMFMMDHFNGGTIQ